MGNSCVKTYITWYDILWSCKNIRFAWAMGDIGVGLMAWLNIVAILLLSNIVMKCFKDYENQMKSGKVSADINFDPIPLGIKNADFGRIKISKKLNSMILILIY